MLNSIRARLLAWYAIVLVGVIGGFAGVLYYQVRAYRLDQVDERLTSAARYLDATLRVLPPHELEGRPPRDFPVRPPREPGSPDGPPPGPRPPLDGPNAFRPPPRRGPDDLRREPPPRRPPERPPAERLRAALELPETLLEPDDRPEDRPYFTIWRRDGSVFAASDQDEVKEAAEWGPPDAPAVGGTQLQWRPSGRREAVAAGPHGTILVVGKPLGRLTGELRAFAWQTFGTGLAVLVVGLAGGWIISRSITRPIAAISRTASAISASNLSKRIDTGALDRELVGLAAVLNDTFARLEAAFVRQSRFTSDASHELRTPLAVLRSHVELALARPRSAEEYRETLDACLRRRPHGHARRRLVDVGAGRCRQARSPHQGSRPGRRRRRGGRPVPGSRTRGRRVARVAGGRRRDRPRRCRLPGADRQQPALQRDSPHAAGRPRAACRWPWSTPPPR